MFGGEWRIDRDGHRATITIAPFEPIGATERTALEDEAMRLLAFIANGADPEIVVLAAATGHEASRACPPRSGR